ncbi:hypothetical protein LA080_004157 [Diaporthe eres]|nr:hypothetical protein LA080_004157 [Diaporthe eres]
MAPQYQQADVVYYDPYYYDPAPLSAGAIAGIVIASVVGAGTAGGGLCTTTHTVVEEDDLDHTIGPGRG